MTRCHPLIPFDLEKNIGTNKYSVNAFAFLNAAILTLKFQVNDPHHEVDWPEQQKSERCDYLWENTCFEAFISSPNQRSYFEVNLSPSLTWNLYRFTDYRTPNDMPPLRVLEPALIQFEIEDRTITAKIDLNALKLVDQEIQLGLTAVIKTADSLQYLAVHHPKPQADFHDSMGWTIRLVPDAPK